MLETMLKLQCLPAPSIMGPTFLHYPTLYEIALCSLFFCLISGLEVQKHFVETSAVFVRWQR
jgi:hypothetical protein